MLSEEKKVEKINKTSIIPLDDGYGFGVKHEMRFRDSECWNEEGMTVIKIENYDWLTSEPMILLTGTDSGGYDSTWIPIDAKQARAVADLLVKLADDLETGAWKK